MLLSERECAAILGLTHLSLANMRRRGLAPPHVIIGSRLIRYPRADLEAWIASRLRVGRELIRPPDPDSV